MIPETRPTKGEIFSSIELNYKLALNVVALIAFVALNYLTVRGGATDPVCGMTVDRAKALRLEHGGRTYSFCSEQCRDRFEAEPQRYTRPSAPSSEPQLAREARFKRLLVE